MGKLKIAELMSKMLKVQHMDMKCIETKEATEVKIEPCTKSYFNIDGEIYNNDHVTVKHLPGYLRLLGTILPN